MAQKKLLRMDNVGIVVESLDKRHLQAVADKNVTIEDKILIEVTMQDLGLLGIPASAYNGGTIYWGSTSFNFTN